MEYEDSEGSDAFEDEDEDDGPALVCSCTLGGPTVVIEAKEDEVKEVEVEDEVDLLNLQNQTQLRECWRRWKATKARVREQFRGSLVEMALVGVCGVFEGARTWMSS